MTEYNIPGKMERILLDFLWYLKIANRRLNYLIPDITNREKLDLEKLEQFINHFSFNNLSSGRARGVANEVSHYRKGVAGDWRNHFNENHKEHFKEIYGDLLVKLQYEASNEW
jgi:hypothetical protein